MLILFCVFFVFQLTGCQSGGQSTGSVPHALSCPPEDRNQAYFWEDFVETPEGYYYGGQNLASDESVKLIYFCPRGGTAFRPLCSKPNCQHNDMNCNAWYGQNFGYYNGAIYSVDFYSIQDKISLIKMNLDGSEHQVVAQVDDRGLENLAFSFMFHYGKLFVRAYADNDLPLDLQQDHLIVFDLSNNSQAEPVKDYLCTARLPEVNWYYNDTLFGLGTGEKINADGIENMKLIAIDTATGETQMPIPGYITGLYATDSTWYYFEQDLSAINQESKKTDAGFREYDLKSGTIKDCGLPVADIRWARRDEDYIYAGSLYHNERNDYTLYFLSKEYEFVDKIELRDKMSIVAITSDRIYFAPYASGLISCYLDKSQIGNGKLSLIPIETAE